MEDTPKFNRYYGVEVIIISKNEMLMELNKIKDRTTDPDNAIIFIPDEKHATRIKVTRSVYERLEKEIPRKESNLRLW